MPVPIHQKAEYEAKAQAASALLRDGRGGFRAVRLCLSGMCVASLGAFLIVGAIFVRLTLGAIDLAFLDEPIRRVIANAAGPGHHAELEAVDLAWDEGNLRLAVHGLKLSRDDGLTIGLAPKAYLGLDLSSLVMGKIEATSLKAYQPSISLSVARDGTVTLGGPAQAPSDGVVTPVLALLDPELIGRTFGAKTLVEGGGSLAVLDLNDVTLTLTDERAGQTRIFQRFSASFQRTELGAFSTMVSSSGSRGEWHASIAVDHPRAEGRSFSLNAAQISLRDVLGKAGGTLGGVVLDLSMGGMLRPDGDMAGVDGTIGIGGDGALEGPGWQADIHPARVSFSLTDGAKDLLVTPSSVAIGGLGGKLSGRLSLPSSRRSAGEVTLDLKLGEITVDREGGKVPEITEALLRGRFDTTSRTLQIDEGRVFGEKPVAEASGTMIFVDKSPAMKLEIDARNIVAASVKRVWPRFIATDAYDWFIANVKAGELTASHLTLDIPPGVLDGRPLERDYVRGEWQAKGASVLLHPDLPPITGASAKVNSTGTSVRAEGRDGKIDTSAGALSLPSVVFEAHDMNVITSPARLEAAFIGQVAALLELGDKQGLGVGKNAGVDIRRITGEGIAQIVSAGPLYQGKPGAEKVPSSLVVDAELRNVAGKGLVDGKDVERGTFKVHSDGRSLAAEGTAQVAGVPFKVGLSQENPKAKLILRAESELDDGARGKLGIDLGELMSGPVGLTFIREVLGGEQTRRVEADLTRARLSLAEASFEKAKGVPGSLTMTLRGQNPFTSLEDLTLQGRGFLVKGRIKFDAGGQPSLYEFSEVKLRPDDQFAARYEIRPEGNELKISGHALDARPFIQKWMSEDDSAATTAKRFQLSLQLDQALGNNGIEIRDVRLDYGKDGRRLSDFSLNGHLAGAARITGQVLKDKGRPYLLVTATDAGSVLQFMDVYRNMRAGKLSLTQTLVDPQGRSEDGVVLIENFQLVNEESLQRLFGAAAPAEDHEGAETRRKLGSADNVTLERMRVVYSRSPGQTQISDGVLRNASFGTTFNGKIDWRRKRVDFRGTFIPLFALNNLLARIPVLGAFLGGQNEGLIGVNFAVAGPMNGPTLRINPASVVAPGFLRGLFVIPDDPTGLTAPPANGGKGGTETK